MSTIKVRHSTLQVTPWARLKCSCIEWCDLIDVGNVKRDFPVAMDMSVTLLLDINRGTGIDHLSLASLRRRGLSQSCVGGESAMFMFIVQQSQVNHQIE